MSRGRQGRPLGSHNEVLSGTVEELGEVRMASPVDQGFLIQGVCPACQSHRVGRLTVHQGVRRVSTTGWYCRDCMMEWAMASEKRE